MTMQFSQLRTYWTADDAHLIISFLDELKDTLWATYGADIIEQRKKENQQNIHQEDQQLSLEFDDAIDFIAWYNQVSSKRLSLAKNNAYALYLAYHEGQGGYERGTYKKKSWLISVAKKVSQRSNRYTSQLAKCEDRLNSSWWPF